MFLNVLILTSYFISVSITGSENHPAKVGVAMTDIVTGTFAHGAILTALYDRAAHPEAAGQRVDCKYQL